MCCLKIVFFSSNLSFFSRACSGETPSENPEQLSNKGDYAGIDSNQSEQAVPSTTLTEWLMGNFEPRKHMPYYETCLRNKLQLIRKHLHAGVVKGQPAQLEGLGHIHSSSIYSWHQKVQTAQGIW